MLRHACESSKEDVSRASGTLSWECGISPASFWSDFTTSSSPANAPSFKTLSTTALRRLWRVCFAKLPGIHGSKYDGFNCESAGGGESFDSVGEKNVLGLSHSFKIDSEEAKELPEKIRSIDPWKVMKDRYDEDLPK